MKQYFKARSVVCTTAAIFLSLSTIAEARSNNTVYKAEIEPELAALIAAGNWTAVANFAWEKAIRARFGQIKLPSSSRDWDWIGVAVTENALTSFNDEFLAVLNQKLGSNINNHAPHEIWEKILKIDFKGKELDLDLNSSGRLTLRDRHKAKWRVNSRTPNVPCYNLVDGCTCSIFHYGDNFRLKGIAQKLSGKKGIIPIFHVTDNSIIFKFLRPTSLANYLKTNPNLTVHAKLLLIQDILDGLLSMRSIIHTDNGVTLPLEHSDLKASNILIDYSEGARTFAYVSDFDFSGKWSDLCVSSGWTASEVEAAFHVIKRDDIDSIAKFHRSNQGKKDIWSLGLLISMIIDEQLLELSNAFYGLSALPFIRKVASLNSDQMFVNTLMLQQSDIDADFEVLISEAVNAKHFLIADLWRLVKRCLKVKPEARPTLLELSEEFNAIFARYHLIDELK